MNRNSYRSFTCAAGSLGASAIGAAFLAVTAVGCGSVVVESTGASSESAASTASGFGGASAGAGSAAGGAGMASGGTASSGTDGPADCTAPKVTVLASKQWHPAAIALDADNVYWGIVGAQGQPSDTAHVFVVPKAGGTPVEIAATAGYMYSVLVDDTHVYWSVLDTTTPPGNGVLYAMPKTGGPVAKLYTSKYGYLVSLTMDEDRFYWGTGAKSIVSLPKSGGEQTVLAQNALPGLPHAVIVNQDRIYWRGGIDQLMSTPNLGGAAQAVTDVNVVKRDFAVDDDQVFWVDAVGDAAVDAIFAAPTGGGEPVDILHDPDSIRELYQFGSCLYWKTVSVFSKFAWQLHAAKKNGADPVVLYSHPFSVSPHDAHVAVDASGVYWVVDDYSGAVMKATK